MNFLQGRYGHCLVVHVLVFLLKIARDIFSFLKKQLENAVHQFRSYSIFSSGSFAVVRLKVSLMKAN